MRDEYTRLVPLPVVIQPDPALDSQPVGWVRAAVTMLGGAAVVVLVLFGLSQTEPRQQVATAPQASQSETTGSGASTTGQGQSDHQSQSGRGRAPRSDSATNGSTAAPSDKAATSK